MEESHGAVHTLPPLSGLHVIFKHCVAETFFFPINSFKIFYFLLIEYHFTMKYISVYFHCHVIICFRFHEINDIINIISSTSVVGG